MTWGSLDMRRVVSFLERLVEGEEKLRLLSMGNGSLSTIMTASMSVGTPARAQTINNGPMVTCTGRLTAGEAIKFSENRWV
ncbi:hypothetical protein TNCV_4265921 [Trichonephila clavipes]|nr:hypothetical protein TNCV_4265921 [Trichonephila clavipes]